MNPDFIKEEITKNRHRRVLITVYGMRGKTNSYRGIIEGIYPNIFTIKDNNFEKSFSYSDVITGDIKIKYE